MVAERFDYCQRCGGYDCPGTCEHTERVYEGAWWYTLADGGEDMCSPCAVTKVAVRLLTWDQLTPQDASNLWPGPDDDVTCCNCGCKIVAGSLEREDE